MMTKHKQRLFYLDWVRALATIMIVITHFNNPYLTRLPPFPNSPFGIYLGDLGVSQFLIISGAALMLTYGDQDRLDLKTFYWKRFKSIYPMFWLAFIIANAYLFIVNHGTVAARAPKRSLILSLIGMDGYLTNAGLATFYTLGEWFLGFIVLYYLIFPILRYGVMRRPWLTAIIVLTLYAGTLTLHPQIGRMPENLLLTTRLPELVFGMYYIRYAKTVAHPVAIVCLIFLTIQQITGLAQGDVAVTLVGIACFLTLVWISRWIDHRAVKIVVGSIAKYSYAIFLVHHQVINQVYSAVLPDAVIGKLSAYLLFFADMLIIAALSICLQRLNTATINYVSAMTGRSKSSAH